MISFQVEKYNDAIDEIKPYYQAHYEELASNKEIPLNPDYEAYDRLADEGLLHVVTVRNEGELVGYFICVISYHIHYKHSLTAHTDIYYLRKDFRSGGNGTNLFKFVEKSLAEIGVERIYMMTKTDSNKGAIFERLGYVEKERIYTKMIGV